MLPCFKLLLLLWTATSPPQVRSKLTAGCHALSTQDASGRNETWKMCKSTNQQANPSAKQHEIYSIFFFNLKFVFSLAQKFPLAHPLNNLQYYSDVFRNTVLYNAAECVECNATHRNLRPTRPTFSPEKYLYNSPASSTPKIYRRNIQGK